MNQTEFTETIQEIAKYPRPTHWIYEFEIHVGEDIKFRPISSENNDYVEDYVNTYGSSQVITLSMKMGDYTRHIYPNRNKPIYIKVIKKYVAMNTTNELNMEPLTMKFRAFCYDHTDLDLNSLPNIDQDQVLESFKFELIDVNVYDAGMRLIGAPFKKTSKIDILKYYFQKAAEALPENIRCRGITAMKPSVETVKDQLVVKHGTALTDLPRVLQEDETGIYNHGIATFFNTIKKRWYIFPPYKTNMHKESNDLLEIFVSPPNFTGMLDKTWIYEVGKKRRLRILTTSNYKSEDIKTFNFLNAGNAVKFVKATDAFHRRTKIDANKLTFSDEHMAGFFLEERDEERQIAKYTAPRVSNNVAHSMSQLSARAGMYLSIVWTNARPDLLIPGMPVNIHYLKEGDVGLKIGTLHKVIVNESRVRPGMNNTVMNAEVILIVFVDDPNTDIKQM